MSSLLMKITFLTKSPPPAPKVDESTLQFIYRSVLCIHAYMYQLLFLKCKSTVNLSVKLSCTKFRTYCGFFLWLLLQCNLTWPSEYIAFWSLIYCWAFWTSCLWVLGEGTSTSFRSPQFSDRVIFSTIRSLTRFVNNATFWMRRELTSWYSVISLVSLKCW